MSIREFDTHTIEVTYRTERMAAKDAERLRSCGWRVYEFEDGRPSIHVETYKPESLFGHADLVVRKRPPESETNYWINMRWSRGIVSWSLACGCAPWRLETDYRPAGIAAKLQSIGFDGKIFWPAADYVIEYVSWPCVERDQRASVAVLTPDEPHWRGRTIRVEESAIVALLDLTSAQRQAYIDTRDIPAVEDTYPVEGLA